MEKGLHISEAAETLSVPSHNIRYWQKVGLLRVEGGILDFEDLRRVRLIDRFRRQGVSLQKIRQTLSEITERGQSAWQKLELHESGELVERQASFLRDSKGQNFLDFTLPESPASRLVQYPVDSGSPEDIAMKMLRNALESESSDKMTALLKQITERWPDFTPAYLELGNLYFTEEKLNEADSWYSRILEYDPACVEALYNLGNIYFKQKKHAAAIRLYNLCIEYDPEFPESYYNLGLVYYGLQSYEKAQVLFELYLELDNDSMWSEHARQFKEDIQQLLLAAEGELFQNE